MRDTSLRFASPHALIVIACMVMMAVWRGEALAEEVGGQNSKTTDGAEADPLLQADDNRMACYPVPSTAYGSENRDFFSSSSSPHDDPHQYLCTFRMEQMAESITLSDMPRDGSVSISGETWQFLLEHTGVPQRVDGSVSEKWAALKVLYQMEHYFRAEVLARPEYATAKGECANHNELCAFWSSVGECENNRGFMLNNCAAACRLCLLLHTNRMMPI
jgi:hypothetical protein